MVRKIKYHLGKIPEGSRLERYVRELREVIGERAEALSFLEKMFLECEDYVLCSTDVVSLPRISLRLVYSHQLFIREHERESKRAISKEIAKAPVHAFVVGTKYYKRMYVDMEEYFDLLKHGYPTFILNLVETFIHEILHVGFPWKYEQEIYDLQCSLIQGFLGTKLPIEKLRLKASDYYTKSRWRRWLGRLRASIVRQLSSFLN